MSEGELIIPKIPDPILTIFENDYPQLKELLDYKRDATLIFLKSSGAMAIYRGLLGLNFEKDVKDWSEFKKFSVSYTKSIVQAGLQKYQTKEEGLEEKKKQFNNLSMGILDPMVDNILDVFNEEYFKKFPNWSSNGRTQKGFIELNIKSHLENCAIRIYGACKGTIFVKDSPGCLYRVEIFGKPELSISYFDLERIKLCNELAKNNMSLIKSKLDELDNKLINQQLEELLLNKFEF